MHNDILLGEGTFIRNGVPIAVTRGGSKFSIERVYKKIVADGDYGGVKGRIRKDMSIAKLVLNTLEMLPTNFTGMYPATKVTTTVDGLQTTEVWEAKAEIEDADYQDNVVWAGRTMTGKAVTIDIQNGLNLDNIEWSFIDKDEVVPTCTYEGMYDNATRTKEPWNVTWVTNGITVDAANSTVIAENSPQPADDFIEVTITLKDASSNLIIDAELIDFSFDYGAAVGTITTPFFNNNGDGTYSILYVNDTAEAATLTVTAKGVEITQTAVLTWT